MDNTSQEGEDDPYTFGEFLSSFAMVMAVIAICLVAGVSLADEPHGMQLVILIGYSGAIFILTFRRSRYASARYNVRAPYVQRQLPRLLLIHCVYLVALYVVGGWILRMRPQLPDFVQMSGFILIGASQIAFSRKTLSRAKAQSARQIAADGNETLTLQEK